MLLIFLNRKTLIAFRPLTHYKVSEVIVVWYNVIVLCVYETELGPYDFRDAEKADGIAESSHRNGIYCITWNVTDFAKFCIWINQK